MPTTKTRIKIQLTEIEFNKIAQRAIKQGVSISNYFRKLAGLKPLQHGGSRGQLKESGKILSTENNPITSTDD